MRAWFVSFVVALIALFLHGCGPGNTTTGQTATTPVRFTVQWAERSRNIAAPASALSAVIRLPNARAVSNNVFLVVNRSSNTAAHSETYTSSEPVGVGRRQVDVTFYAGADGTGSVVATASATVQVSADGEVLDTITNVQRKVTSVQVESGQTLTVGEQQFLAFTARDADGNILAVSPGSARFTSTQGADLLAVTGIVGQGLKSGTAQVTATVDGVTSAPEDITVLPGVRIAYIANAQSPGVIAFLQVLQARNVTPTVFPNIPDPVTLQQFDVLLVGGSGNIGTSDAAKVKAFLDTGRGVVLLGPAPAILATGSADLDRLGFGADLTPIAAWFGNVQRMGYNNRPIFARTNPGMFSLPAEVAPGEQIQPGADFLPAIRPTDITNPVVDKVALVTDYGFDAVYAFAYELPQTGQTPPGRVYWQWDPQGTNTDYTNKVISLFLAGTHWTARR
jgi:hypothetical protein